MDLKPKVTCFGDKDVYSKLNPELEKRLPREYTEWRRSYGRPPKTVKLKANFVRLSQDMLVDVSSIETYQSASNLHKQPFFHIYWTDCQDPDEFKSSVKDGITDWMRKLRDRNIVDWMIIHVISQDSFKGSKPKIQLPRSTVFDKIKSDFGNKNSDRIIQLWEPFKENQLTRSVESWQNLVTKLRQLLLVSFNRHLGKFEDQVRALREKRTEPRWSFTTYFSLHEELAFVFEMLGLFEEALIQYDEIDALLTQLVINSNFGEPLDCIDVFMRDCKCCDGVSLDKGPQEFLGGLIKTQEASYIDLRNYLFSRQCNLLLKLNRPSPWEVAQRTLDFLHNLIHELSMETLKISMPTGGASCSVILTCLEVLQACEKQNSENGIAYSLHFALLYQYARQKLDDLGALCGLLPDMTPSETELQTVCILLSGIGKTQGEEELEPRSPAKRLQEALSSRRAFESLYLELTELAISIYKNIGRYRAAKFLGMDLAQFYSSRGEFERAEPLLVDAYKMYKHERWTLLATQCLVNLSRCQKQLKHMDKYAASCAVLACERHLAPDKRSYYTQELLQVMRETMESAQAIIVRAEPLLRVEDVKIDLMKGIGSVGECIKVKLKLFSALEEEVTCGRISFSIQTNELKRVGSVRSSRRTRAASPPVVVVESGLTSAALSEEDLSDKPEGQATEEEADSNGAEMQRPPLPTPKPDSKTIVKSVEDLNVLPDVDSDCCLQCFNAPLRYGINEYILTAQLAEIGHYHLKQLCVEIGKLDFVWPKLSLSRESRGFAIVADPPRIRWSHDNELHLISGLSQQVTLSISVEPGSIASGSVLEITSQKRGITFEPIHSGEAIIQSSMDEENKTSAPYSVQVLAVHGDDDVADISVAMVTLPAIGPYAKIDLKLIIQAPLQKQSLQEEVTEYKLLCNCKWLSPAVTADLTGLFHRPFAARHILHSSETTRFIQVIVTGTNPVDLVIQTPELIITNCSSVKLTPMHSNSEYVIFNQQDMSFLWKLETEEGSPPELDCEFKTSFFPKQATEMLTCSSETSSYLHDFHVANTQTLYTITSTMKPTVESGNLLAGSSCKLHITFTRLSSHGDASNIPQLLYEVDSDTNLWAVNGRKRGVIAIPYVAKATTDVVLDVIPQTGGNLAMPAIKLMKYVEKEDKPQQKDSKEGTGADAQSARACPLVCPFLCGQVYNRTLATRVRVLPNNNTESSWI